MRVRLEQRDLHPRLGEHSGVLVADAERVIRWNVVHRLDQHRHARSRELVRDLPALGGARENQLQLVLAADPQRRAHVAHAVGIDDERHLAAQHREQRLELGGGRRELLHLGARVVGLAPRILERVVKDATQPARDTGARIAAGALAALRHLHDDPHL